MHCKVSTQLDKLKRAIIWELRDGLLIVKNAHHSNELIVKKLLVAQTEQDAQLYSALQNDMELINEQIILLLKTVKSLELVNTNSS